MKSKIIFSLYLMLVVPLITDEVYAQFITFSMEGADNTYITCINDSNVFGGYYFAGSAVHGFMCNGIDTTILDFPGAVQTFVYGINNFGDAVGSYNTTGVNTDNEGFVYDHIFKTFTNITSSWLGGQDITIARDINDAGCIVGDYKQNTTHVCFSMCAGVNSVFHYNYNPTYINSLNNNGKRTGLWIDGSQRHGLIWDAGVWTQLDYPGAMRTMLSSMNDDNVVVGVYDLIHSFVYKGGVFKQITKWDAVDIQVKDINNNGFIAGIYKTSSGGYKGFYQSIWDIGFRPDTNGWSFSNSSANIWPSSWYNQFNYSYDPYLGGWASFPEIIYSDGTQDTVPRKVFPDWPLFVDTYGESNCYFNFLGIPLLKTNAFNKWRSKIGWWGGSCFGFVQSSFMAWDSLSRFKATYPFVGPWGFDDELYELPLTDANRLCINGLMIKQHQKYFKRHINTEATVSPRTTLKRLKQMMLDNENDEQGLCFLNQNGSGGHIVNPYKILIDTVNPNFEWIYIYDNNYPGDTTRKVKIDKALNSWYYNLSANAGDAGAEWGGNTAHKGTFITFPASHFYAQPDVDSVAKSPLTGGKSVNFLEVYSTPYSNTYIINSARDTVGYANSQIIEKMPGASVLVPLTGGLSLPEGYIVPESEYQAITENFSTDVVNFSVNTDEYDFYYSRANATVAEHDRFVFNKFGMKAINADPIAKNINMVCIAASDDFVKDYTVSEVGMVPNSMISFTLLPNDQLKIVNEGEATSYSLKVKYMSETVSGTYFHANIELAANTTHVVVTDWPLISSVDVCLQIDFGNDGSVDETTCPVNEGEPEIIAYPTLIEAVASPATAKICVGNPGAGVLNWLAASDSPSWLSIVGDQTGANSDSIVISIANNAGGSRSGEISFTGAGASNSPYVVLVQQAGVVASPQNVDASDGSFSDGVHVTWDVVAGASHSMVYRSNVAGSTGQAITGWIPGNSYVDITAIDGKFYYYSIKSAQNVTGLNASSNSATNDGWRAGFEADFEMEGLCAGQPTVFTDMSSAHTTTVCKWDFNNDGTDDFTGPSASHLFSTAGSYPVKLTVTDANSVVHSKTKSVVIVPFATPSLVQGAEVCEGETTLLDAGAGFDTYFWSTGATTQSITLDSTGYGRGTHHVYVQLGTNNGCSAYDTTRVTFKFCAAAGVPCTSCPGFETVVYGGNTYNTVLIGSQCWLRENLAIGTMIPSRNAQSVALQQTDNQVIEKYCYDDNPANCDVYGGLYQWREMMNYSQPGRRGICPEGWHVPDASDWNQLQLALGGAESAGGILKEEGTVHWVSVNVRTEGESCFNALPAGLRAFGGKFFHKGTDAHFWTSDSAGQSDLRGGTTKLLMFNNQKTDWGFSVRCLKD